MSQNAEGPGLSLLFGIMLIVVGALSIATGKSGHVFGIFGQIPVANWIGWAFLTIGITISILSIRSLWRGGGKPKKYTDEEVARAKDALDRMYFQEHGVWPKADNKKGDS